MKRETIAMIGFVGLIAGCADFPDLNAAISDDARRATFPQIMEIGDIVVSATEGLSETEAATAALLARAERLKQRARILRRPVLDDQTRAAMAQAVKRHLP